MVRIGVGACLASWGASKQLGVPDGGKCPPPPREKAMRYHGVGVALVFSWEPLAENSTRDGGEGTIRVVCNDEGGSFVRWLHGGGHEMSGLKVPM